MLASHSTVKAGWREQIKPAILQAFGCDTGHLRVEKLEMGELILHIGAPKTGTSSLQRFLFDNRDIFAEHDVYYPIFTDQPGPPRLRNGIFLNQYCHGKDTGSISKYVNDEEENLRRLAQSLSEHGRTLLSDENFFHPRPRFLEQEQLRVRYWGTVAEVARESGAQDVTVVIYLRRQDDWVSSRWRENVKSGWTDKALGAFCTEPIIRYAMDYLSLLESIEAGFSGGARIVVRRYDRCAFEGGDIFRDFCAAADIPWDSGYVLPERENNPSLSFDAAEAVRTFAKAVAPRTALRNDALIPLARQPSRQNPDQPGTTPFDEAATRLLMEPYLAGNEAVSAKYLNGKPLFSWEYGGRPVWKPDERRIAEYRAAFEEAIRAHTRQQTPAERFRSFMHGHTARVKRSIRTLISELVQGKTL